MKLKRLMKELPIQMFKGSKEIEITGVCANSKLVAPGNLFIARKGKVEDGVQYIPEAVAAGAVAVLTDIYDPTMKNIAQLVHPDVAALESIVAAHYYQQPSEKMLMVGITGTNGKTTTSFLVKHLLDRFQGLCGLIGTIEYIIGKSRYQATRTTPDVSSNHKMLREMVLQGCQSAAMEVTSHALDQGRVDNIHFDVAIFTNLTLDHLDYHKTWENYCAAKNKLFRNLHQKKSKKNYRKTAVVNRDSSWYEKIIDGCEARILTYGIDRPSDLMASDLKLDSSGTSFTLKWEGRELPCRAPLVGRYNVYNSLAALGAVISQGFPIEEAAERLSCAPSVPGRIEPVPNPLELRVYVDFAHTDDALANVLECLKEFTEGRIFVVFGCGGDRDKTKRPRMARVCEEMADFCIVTSDNPRSEDPERIAKEIAAGFAKKESFSIELDRRRAIEKAIRLASKEDIVLIAGKGHENYQIFAHKTIEFDDKKTALEICKQIAMERCEVLV